MNCISPLWPDHIYSLVNSCWNLEMSFGKKTMTFGKEYLHLVLVPKGMMQHTWKHKPKTLRETFFKVLIIIHELDIEQLNHEEFSKTVLNSLLLRKEYSESSQKTQQPKRYFSRKTLVNLAT